MARNSNPEMVVLQTSSAANEIIDEIEKVHGPIWAGRQELCKLIITLSSALLAGTITFSGKILETPDPTGCIRPVLVLSWVMTYASICFCLVTMWYSNKFHDIRARLVNSEAELAAQASSLEAANEEQLVMETLALVKKHTEAILSKVRPADRKTQLLTLLALITYCLGIGAFIVCGALKIA